MKTFALLSLASLGVFGLTACFSEDFCDKVECGSGGGAAGTESTTSTGNGPGSTASTSSSQPTSSSGGGGDGGSAVSSNVGPGGGGDGGSGAGGDGSGGGNACSPTDGQDVAEGCAIFVNGDYTGATEAGTQAQPFKSIGDAIAKAVLDDLPIYVCSALQPYAEAVTIEDSVTLIGGFGCQTWEWSAGARTEWTANADTIPLTVRGSTVEVQLQGFQIDGPDAEADGGSSIGVFVDGGSLDVVGASISAGDGRPGVEGQSAAGAGPAGQTGGAGTNGCAAPGTVDGPAGHTLACPDGSFSFGGNGGDGTVPGGGNSNGGDGSSDPEVTTPLVNHGSGQPSGGACSVGTLGASGADGEPGDGGELGSLVSGSGFVGSPGQDGLTNGRPGQGGGGGGGGRGASVCAPTTNAGPSGGGGASGGCGGELATGGGGGGASIAIAVLEGQLSVVDSELSTGDGGDGGDGSGGQLGGSGGPGANGGTFACQGGNGGAGGRGGASGGGSGGPSAGVFWQGEDAPVLNNVGMTIGDRGAKGIGGDGGVGNQGGEGQNGERCAVLTLGVDCTDPG